MTSSKKLVAALRWAMWRFRGCNFHLICFHVLFALIFTSLSALAQPSTNKDAVSREISVFNFGQSSFSSDAVSREVSVFNFGQSSTSSDAVSREVSVFNFGQGSTSSDAVSREVSVFNSGPGTIGSDAVSREVSVYNFGPSSSGVDAVSREVSVFNGGLPSQLGFRTEPIGTNAGFILSPISVQVENPGGMPKPDNPLPVTISLASGDGMLNGTLTQNTDASGLVIFSNLSINLSGPKTLQATTPTLAPAISVAFSIVAAGPTQLSLVASILTPQQQGVPFLPAPVVQIQDQFGNVILNSTAAVTARTSSGGTIGGTTTVHADGSTGSAVFHDLFCNLSNPAAAGSVLVYFTSPGLAPVTNSVTFLYLHLTGIMLSNGNSVIQINPTTQDGMFSWTVEGTNQMYQHWFWLRQDPGNTQSSFDQLGIPLGLVYTATSATLSYFPQGLDVTLSFTLKAGMTGSYASDDVETVSIQNTNNYSVGLHVYDYTDFDLAGEADGDTISFAASNMIVQQGKGMSATQYAQNPPADLWEATWYALTLDTIDDDAPAVLSDEIFPNESGDQTYAFQWDATLPAGQTLQINLTNSIRLAPPLLDIALASGDAVISWLTNGFANFQLQSSTNLASGTNWIAVTNVPAAESEHDVVTVPLAAGARFYRLEH
jgi:hypothetical protein